MQELALAERFVEPVPLVSEGTPASWAQEEFEARLKECAGVAFRVARGVVHNTADAEELAQEAFLRAYRNVARLREPKSFRAWVVRIAFRLALDRARAARRREARETAWARTRPEATAEDAAAESETRRRVRAALDELPEKFRMVLILTAIEGHSLQDVAEMLGLPEGTVKSRMHFGRKKLAEKLRWLAESTKTS